MNTFQKVVKYIALALALSIIVFIITLAFNIINEVFLSIHEESTQKVEYKFQNEVINRMDIDIKGADVSIIYGSEFKIETNIKDVFRSVKSGVLKVKDNSRGYNKDKKMVITIPESNVFENVKISLGRGVSTISSLNAKEVDFENEMRKMLDTTPIKTSDTGKPEPIKTTFTPSVIDGIILW